MDFLDARGLGVRHVDEVVHRSRQTPSAAPGQAHGDETALAGQLQGLDDVGRPARGRDAHRDVTRAAVGLDLPAKHRLVAHVVADRRDHRRIRGEGDGRERGPVAPEAAHQLAREVLRVGGRSAVAEGEDPAAAAEAFRHAPTRRDEQARVGLEEALLEGDALGGQEPDRLVNAMALLLANQFQGEFLLGLQFAQRPLFPEPALDSPGTADARSLPMEVVLCRPREPQTACRQGWA